MPSSGPTAAGEDARSFRILARINGMDRFGVEQQRKRIDRILETVVELSTVIEDRLSAGVDERGLSIANDRKQQEHWCPVSAASLMIIITQRHGPSHHGREVGGIHGSQTVWGVDALEIHLIGTKNYEYRC
jgi:hypothetical protein